MGRPMSPIGVAKLAAKRFCHPRMFNTACVQSILRSEKGRDVTGDEVVGYLTPELRIVRLSGGCHWYILPEGIGRYEQQGD